MKRVFFLCLIFGTLPNLTLQNCRAQNAAEGDTTGAAAISSTSTELEMRLVEYLNQCQFIGQFTVDGADNPKGKPETYTISKCEKLPAADMYRMTAKIVYGSTDTEVPLDLKILFAGKTPVITIDDLWIPGMGTFSSRVVIHQDRYVGTWQHGKKGGHMFGRIQQLESTGSAD